VTLVVQLIAKRDKLMAKMSPDKRHEGAAFAIFHDPNVADKAHYNCSERLWIVQRATPPYTVLWKNFGRFRFPRIFITALLNAFVVALSVLFSIPSSFFSSLSSYSEIPGIGALNAARARARSLARIPHVVSHLERV